MNGRAALIVTHGVPAFDRDGAGWLSMIAIRALLEDGWAVTVVSEDLHPEDAGRVRVLEQLGAEVYAGPQSVGARESYLAPRDVGTLLEGSGFALVVIQFWGLAEHWIPPLRRLLPQARVIIDSVDVHLLRVIRGRMMGLDGSAQPVLDAELWHAVFGELNVYASADAVFAVSRREADLLGTLLGRERFAFHVPLGSDPPLLDPPPAAGRNGLLYVGGFTHLPNPQAVAVLLDQIVPLLTPELREQHPVRIVGAGITPELAEEWTEHDHVIPVGWAPTLGPEFAQARAFVAPLPNGAGVKTKILLALSAGLPVITNRFGIEGMGVEPGEHVLLAETPQEFAAAIAQVAADDALWTRLSRAGRAWALSESGPGPASAAFRAAVGTVMAR